MGRGDYLLTPYRDNPCYQTYCYHNQVTITPLRGPGGGGGLGGWRGGGVMLPVDFKKCQCQMSPALIYAHVGLSHVKFRK